MINPLLGLALAVYVCQRCVVCDHVFDSVEDMLKRQPKRANAPPAIVELACGDCYDSAPLKPDGTLMKR